MFLFYTMSIWYEIVNYSETNNNDEQTIDEQETKRLNDDLIQSSKKDKLYNNCKSKTDVDIGLFKKCKVDENITSKVDKPHGE